MFNEEHLPALSQRSVHEPLDAGVSVPEGREEDGGLFLHDAQLLAQRLAPDAVDHAVADLLRLLPLVVGNLYIVGRIAPLLS